ncbi:MAG: hypothetical protein N2Z20_03245 [Elusimicrobiales bacterium]|nr:hypothetical protein [Elusimicrobiales bacterium]
MKILLQILVTGVMTIKLNAVSPQEVVDNTIKNLKASKMDKNIMTQAEKDPNYYTLKDGVRVEIKEITPPENFEIPSNITINKGVEQSLVIIEKIVNIASKVWDMVVANKPAVNIDTKYAVALPFGVSGPSELSGWSKPKSYLLSFYFENLYGVDVIKVSYQVTYVYGGSYKGKGKYLAAVWAIPVSVDVMWGFSFNMQAFVPDQTVVNVGTSQNPIAALQLKVSWSASSPLRQIDGTGVYYIQGDGYFQELASPFRKSRVNLSGINEDSIKK